MAGFFSQKTGGMEMKMEKTARTALLGALFTVLLVPGAFAQEKTRTRKEGEVRQVFGFFEHLT